MRRLGQTSTGRSRPERREAPREDARREESVQRGSVADVVDQLLGEDGHLLRQQEQARGVRGHDRADVLGQTEAEGEVVLRLDVLHLRELVWEGIEPLDRTRLRAGEVAGDRTVRNASLRLALDVAGGGDEQLALEDV